ncbi:MAG: HAD family hydrolase [Betaproteobacteria bacterium]|nr:HAD family hydrolase [Betaproteobacteria bacterium]MBI2961301.1 HAD family hydrolase [Betaproteobacteria bacterium]
MTCKAVFLDRDGVINRAIVVDGRPYAPRKFSEFRLMPGARAGLARLRKAGLGVVVVTNQPDVARKLIDPEDLDRMNRRLITELAVDAVKVCAHRQDEGCNCRKPRPGMLLDAAAELGIDLQRSYMVGDRWSDVEAGHAAGCYTLKIERGYANDRPARADAVVRTFAQAVNHIIHRERNYA